MGHDQAHRPPFPLQVGHQDPAGLTACYGKGEMVVAEDRILRQQAVSVSSRGESPWPPPPEGGAKNNTPSPDGGTTIRAGPPNRCADESEHPPRSNPLHRERPIRSPRRSAPDPTPRHSPTRGGCCTTSPAPDPPPQIVCGLKVDKQKSRRRNLRHHVMLARFLYILLKKSQRSKKDVRSLPATSLATRMKSLVVAT